MNGPMCWRMHAMLLITCALIWETKTRTRIFGANRMGDGPRMRGKRWPTRHNLFQATADKLGYRKGSMSFKGSNSRRESIARRAAMRLGGLRVITAGGVSCGVDAALYLAGAMVSTTLLQHARLRQDWCSHAASPLTYISRDVA